MEWANGDSVQFPKLIKTAISSTKWQLCTSISLVIGGRLLSCNNDIIFILFVFSFLFNPLFYLLYVAYNV